MKRILFNGLGPRNTVSCGNRHDLKDGDVANMKDEHAQAYIDVGWAIEITDESQVADVRRLEMKNDATRKRIQKKVGEK